MYFLGIELELAAQPRNLRVHPICCALSLTYSDHRPDSMIRRTAGKDLWNMSGTGRQHYMG
jgi:hypothetical protein